MSSLLNPIGSESPRTYWIRRGIALGAIVVVLVALIFVVFRPWQEEPPTPGSSSSTMGLSTDLPTNGTGDITLPRTCAPSSTKLTLSGPSSISATEPVDFTVTVSVSGEACVLDFNAQPFELRVFSGSDRIWSTKDCVDEGLTGMKELAAGETEFKIVRPVRRSSEGCVLSETLLRPGTYVATAEINGISPDQQVMVLS